MTDIHYMSYSISVSLDLKNQETPLTILDNPYIPLYTVATITWAIAPNSDPFEFVELQWCNHGKPLSTPIKRDHVIVAVVSNEAQSDIGSWPYQLSVRPTADPGRVISLGNCSEGCPHPNDGLKLLMAYTGPVIINTGL